MQVNNIEVIPFNDGVVSIDIVSEQRISLKIFGNEIRTLWFNHKDIKAIEIAVNNELREWHVCQKCGINYKLDYEHYEKYRKQSAIIKHEKDKCTFCNYAEHLEKFPDKFLLKYPSLDVLLYEKNKQPRAYARALEYFVGERDGEIIVIPNADYLGRTSEKSLKLLQTVIPYTVEVSNNLKSSYIKQYKKEFKNVQAKQES